MPKQHVQSGSKEFSKSLLKKLKESLLSVLPIAILVIILCLTPLVSVTPAEIAMFVVSAIALVVGVGLFNMGADMAMTPMGMQIGAGLTKSRSVFLLLAVSFVMGALVTVAEPDLSVLAGQVAAVISKPVLIISVGVGVGLFLTLAVTKVVFKKDLSPILLFFYMLAFAICAMIAEQGKGNVLPMAFDSGGVTTGPITVPFIMALGVGVASTAGGSKSRENSFGLIALCSIGPIIAVMALFLISKGGLNYALPEYSTTGDLGVKLVEVLGSTATEVALALGLIAVCFVVLQLFVLKLPMKKLLQIAIGIIYTFVGLLIFFTAVKVGFMPIGYKLGQELAQNKPVLIAVSFLLGLVAVLAEPAIHALNDQVEHITDGAVSKRAMLIALSIGVGISIGLSAIRIIYNFSVLYYLIPGYAISLGLSFMVPKMYTAIAFDSGGVASGPMTASFILPLAIGACSALQGENDALSLGFGIVAMVAMTPLITIQLLGFRAVFASKLKERITMKRIISDDDEQIIEFM